VAGEAINTFGEFSLVRRAAIVDKGFLAEQVSINENKKFSQSQY